MLQKGILTGLTLKDVDRRRKEFGYNEIKREKGVTPGLIFIHQFTSPLIWLLLLASVIAFYLRESFEVFAILAILFLNAIIGFFQEYRAEKAVTALRQMTAPRARVCRSGHIIEIQAKEIVPDDLLVLEAGDIVAADAVLIESHELNVNEASLTGESVPVEKGLNSLDKNLEASVFKKSMVFAGTSIVSGTGIAQVRSIGMLTELGKIAHLITTAQQELTPIQKNLVKVGHALLLICFIVVALVAALGFLQGKAWSDIVLSSISLAVAAVPEGLPAIVTIALAFGVQRMAERNVLVRKLPAVETLGSVTVICTDKTGTLTTGQMKVRELWGKDHKNLLIAAASCCDADLNPHGQTGDSSEVAILQAAIGHGIDRNTIEVNNPRKLVRPFNSSTKRMSILRSDGVLYVKGALEVILPRCSNDTEGALEANKEFAEEGLRVLAVAAGTGPEEENLRLLGLIGIADPPRTEAIEAVRVAKEAGIRTIMITGDHPITAKAIGRELGIITDGDSGNLVHARATAEDKIKIIRYWKDKGEIVAMTGDGVNDAPALREAHIGVAMGKTGTEVTKESSDMILTDDNFASIVAAIREGRGVFENIRKSIMYLLTGNISELLIMLVAAFLTLPLPFLPFHLLWINLITDSLPALALVADPVSKNILNRKPRNPSQPMLGKIEWRNIFLIGALEAAICILVFIWTLKTRSLHEAMSLTFSTLVFSQLFRSFSARSEKRIFWEVGALSNFWLLGVVILSVFIQISLHYIPWTQLLLHLTPLSLGDLALTLGAGLITVSLVEIKKLFIRVGE